MPGNRQQQQDEDEYRRATKTVVDDAMRTDILGPNLCKVLEDHTPAGKLIKSLVADAIRTDPEVRKEFAEFIKNDSTTKRNKWIDRAVAAFLGIIGTGLIQYVISHIK
jgi:hypothetical protein